jgi:hypothetical protein
VNQAESITTEVQLPVELYPAMEEVREVCKRNFVLLETAPEETKEKLEFIHEHHGLHAYRYIQMSDGSILALWANDPSGDIKFKAFPNMDEATVWSPRDER